MNKIQIIIIFRTCRPMGPLGLPNTVILSHETANLIRICWSSFTKCVTNDSRNDQNKLIFSFFLFSPKFCWLE